MSSMNVWFCQVKGWAARTRRVVYTTGFFWTTETPGQGGSRRSESNPRWSSVFPLPHGSKNFILHSFIPFLPSFASLLPNPLITKPLSPIVDSPNSPIHPTKVLKHRTNGNFFKILFCLSDWIQEGYGKYYFLIVNLRLHLQDLLSNLVSASSGNGSAKCEKALNPKKLLVMKKIFTLNNEQTQESLLVTVVMAAIAVVSILF